MIRKKNYENGTNVGGGWVSARSNCVVVRGAGRASLASAAHPFVFMGRLGEAMKKRDRGGKEEKRKTAIKMYGVGL